MDRRERTLCRSPLWWWPRENPAGCPRAHSFCRIPSWTALWSAWVWGTRIMTAWWNCSVTDKEKTRWNTQRLCSQEKNCFPLEQVQKVYVSDAVLRSYAVSLLQRLPGRMSMITLGLSPRGTLALMRMAKAHAFMEKRDYVVPKDVQAVFADVAGHRMVLDTKARYEDKGPRQILEQILLQVPVPRVDG